MTNKIITVKSLKFDGSIHRQWEAEIAAQTKDYWLLIGEFQEPVQHSALGLIKRHTISYEYFLRDTPYNVFRFHEPNGKFRSFYCNLCLPPSFSDDNLSFVDLDIDVLVHQDFSYEVLDEDEFILHTEIYKYPEQLIKTVNNTLDDLKNLIENRDFPFKIPKAEN